jgi:TolB protein
MGINQLAWRPDGKELAFSSGHDSMFSRYHADIYALKPDGKGVRKLTNTPERSAFGRYKQGKVTVVVRNEQPRFSRGMANIGIFTIYIAGAKEPQVALVPPRGSKTLVFPAVADFGDAAQPIVAISGSQRWVSPGTDVKGGTAIKAPDFSISGDGIELFGAFRPTWRRDASRISYRSGLCIISSIDSNPPVARFTSRPFFKGENPSGSCAWDWGPTAELADQVVYIAGTGSETGIFRMTEGGAHPGTKLPVELGEYPFLLDVRWLPDGSGIVFSKVDMAAESSNLFRYDFATRRTTALTKLDDFAHAFSVSPDGRWVVFERTRTRRDDKTADLWLVGTDGTGLRRLVSNGYHPAWGK